MINQILIDYAKNTDMKTLLSLSGSNTNLIRIIEQYQKKYPQLQRYNLPDYIADRIEKFKEQTPEKPIRIKTELKASKIEEKLSEDDMGDFIGTML
jgi:predicted ribonuclease YlaK